MNSNLSKGKRGLIGSSIVMFISIITIVLILIVFVFGAGFVKKVIKGGGVKIYDENDVEIYNIFEYMEEYTALLNVKFFMEKGLSLDKSFSEVSYEK